MNNTLDHVITDGVRFLQSLTEHYGAERGMEIWEQFGNAVGKDVKGRVFFALMTGVASNRVRFYINLNTNAYSPNAVAIIKTIRTYTGLGLKEAKDMYDQSKSSAVTADCKTSEAARALSRDLQSLGCVVH